jgi:aminoglycoside 3-N-acetyltransferase
MRDVLKEGVKPRPELFLESFLRAVGPTGTLVVPLFNFGFSSGQPFDIRNTPSQMGAITEAARLWPGAVRTGHPIYSFAAIGAHVAEFQGLENFSGYGSDSPFGIIHKRGGKIAVLDLPDNGSMTFYHYVEEACSVSYRYHKTFTGLYTDWTGQRERRTFGLFVRDIDAGVVTQVDPAGERLWQHGLYRGERPGEGFGLRTIGAEPFVREVTALIEAGEAKGLIYAVE